MSGDGDFAGDRVLARKVTVRMKNLEKINGVAINLALGRGLEKNRKKNRGTKPYE